MTVQIPGRQTPPQKTDPQKEKDSVGTKEENSFAKFAKAINDSGALTRLTALSTKEFDAIVKSLGELVVSYDALRKSGQNHTADALLRDIVDNLKLMNPSPEVKASYMSAMMTGVFANKDLAPAFLSGIERALDSQSQRPGASTLLPGQVSLFAEFMKFVRNMDAKPSTSNERTDFKELTRVLFQGTAELRQQRFYAALQKLYERDAADNEDLEVQRKARELALKIAQATSSSLKIVN